MSKTKSEEKEKILLENGYKYHFLRTLYFNLKTQKVFSFEAIDDHPIKWIEDRIKKKNDEDWEFYWSVEAPNENIKSDIIKELKNER